MIITLKDAKKTFGGHLVLEKLNFDINEGEKVGLVGRNGSGKTTIFKLITKLEELDDGQMFIKKDTKVGYLAQIPNFSGQVRDFLSTSFGHLKELQQEMKKLEKDMQIPDLMEKAMVRYGELQEAFVSQGGYEMDAKIQKVAHGLSIQGLLSNDFNQLSGGEKTKVGLAKILLEEPDVLLLDEPTNHLDLQAIEWLEEYLKQFAGACCIISHDRYFLDQVVTKIADLENNEITMYHGNFSWFVKEKEERLLAEFKAFQEQQKKIKKMKEAIKRLKLWANQANPPNEGLHKRARNMERALERMEKLDKPLLDPKKMDLAFSAKERSGNDVLVVEGVTKKFDKKSVLKGIDLHLRYQERLAIVGPNGSGKTTLLKILLGNDQATNGHVRIGSQVKMGYLPQNPLEDVDDEISLIDYFREHIRVTEGQARQILARFMFFGFSVFRKVGQLSGGERMRLKLAIFMHQGLNLLVLDEPTNHLDLDSQEVLEEAIEQFDGTILCVSHDRYFLNQCFNETAYLANGLLHRFPGNYQETKNRWESIVEQPTVQQDKTKSTPKSSNHTPKEKVLNYEVLIADLEEKISQLEMVMFEENDIEKLQELQKEKQQMEEELERQYALWMEKQN